MRIIDLNVVPVEHALANSEKHVSDELPVLIPEGWHYGRKDDLIRRTAMRDFLQERDIIKPFLKRTVILKMQPLRLEVKEFSPSKRLKQSVKKYLIIEATHDVENLLVPDTSLAVAFRLKGHTSFVHKDGNIVAIGGSVISGLRHVPRRVRYTAGSAMLIVLFRELGASSFFANPLSDFFNSSIGLNDLDPGDRFAHIELQLSWMTSREDQVALVDQFFSAHFRPRPDPLIAHAVQIIQSRQGIIRIHDLAMELCISNDAFEKRFRKVIGASPKQFARIVRMRSIINGAVSADTLTGMALDAGFYDQSHFIKDFRAFTGQAPKEFFAKPQRW